MIDNDLMPMVNHGDNVTIALASGADALFGHVTYVNGWGVRVQAMRASDGPKGPRATYDVPWSAVSTVTVH